MVGSARDSEVAPLIVVIGAARSGTNILRDCLTGLDGFSTWPCDEINYIWRHKNRAYLHDQFPADLARPAVVHYLRTEFSRQASHLGCKHLVEKTTANSLRVGFVHKVFPDAKFIFIYRHGLDSVYSATKRWKASLDIPYLARKARFVPKSDIPYYGLKYLKTRIKKHTDTDNALSTWGPKPAVPLVGNVIERAALQWSECVRCSQDQAMHIPDHSKVIIKYEDFVNSPADTLLATVSSLGLDCDLEAVADATKDVHVDSVSKARRSMDSDQLSAINRIIGPQLQRLGYE